MEPRIIKKKSYSDKLSEAPTDNAEFEIYSFL
jgi:hypothetical protein